MWFETPSGIGLAEAPEPTAFRSAPPRRFGR
jgi:hypothetical protein